MIDTMKSWFGLFKQIKSEMVHDSDFILCNIDFKYLSIV